MRNHSTYKSIEYGKEFKTYEVLTHKIIAPNEDCFTSLINLEREIKLGKILKTENEFTKTKADLVSRFIDDNLPFDTCEVEVQNKHTSELDGKHYVEYFTLIDDEQLLNAYFSVVFQMEDEPTFIELVKNVEDVNVLHELIPLMNSLKNDDSYTDSSLQVKLFNKLSTDCQFEFEKNNFLFEIVKNFILN